MKITIGILVLIGILLLILAKRIDGHTTNPDDWSAAFTEFGGFLFLAAAFALTVCWGIYRLFTS